MDDVSRWLAEQGLGHHAEAFAKNGIGSDVLRDLTDADLKELGLNLGDRKRLLKAIAGLNATATPDTLERAEPTTPAIPRDPERRQLTVMFIDLVGSTEFARRLDPEELGGIMRGYRSAVAGEVARFDGHVAKFMGDGVLAYFGWPRAHEDEAERAVRAGLAIPEAVRRLAAPEHLVVRIGIATGLVMVGELVGEGAVREETVIGETPNLAARLQALAEPGTLVIAEGTRRLLGGLFELEDLGAQAVKGFDEQVRVFRVLGESLAESRFEARRGAASLPLVGREQELALLMDRWALARQGEGQVVLLSGEAGIGKSRVVQALREHLRQEPRTSLRYFCSPYHTNSALHPLIVQLERAAGFTRDDPPAARLAKLEALLARAISDLAEATELLAEFLGLPSERQQTPELTPKQRRARTFQVLLAHLEGLAAKQPILMVLEDAHWLDPTSLELFGLVVDRIQRLPVLLVVTHRPEFESPWRGYPHVTLLTLHRLARAQAQAMVGQLTGGRALPTELLAHILVKTEGVPLFVEELTKTVLESGLVREEADGYALCGPLPPLAIPATLQDSLMARLDRLSSVKDVAQIAACIGREFDHALLAAVADLAAERLEEALSELMRAELLFRRGALPEATYSFKHALVRDAAYQSLLRSRRQQLHGRIAKMLEARFPETAESQPEVLAHHFIEAGLPEQAIAYWYKAGLRAGERSANVEAIAHLTTALNLVEELSDDAEHTRQELRLQVALGPVLVMTKSYAAAEVERAYLRAQELARSVGEPSQLFAATWGLWLVNLTRMQLDGARTLADELLRLARVSSDPAFLLQAHHVAWTTLFCVPELTPCLEHVEQGRALYDPDVHRAHKFLYGGHDPGVCGYNHGALALWLLGYPDQAVERVQEGRVLARDLGHDFTSTLASQMSTFIHQFRGEIASARQCAEETVAISTEKGVAPHMLAAGRIFLGWAASGTRRAGEEGLEEIRKGLARLDATGVQLRRPYYLTLYADACARTGLVTEGLGIASEAIRGAERWWEAEAHRLRGELLLAQSAGNRGEAEACFRNALEIARRQSARSLELRAATSLARLWVDRGEWQEAHNLLAPIYGWFTEGFNTADLKDAKALLDGLA